ncbi:conserved hypothetical protein [Ricinus communis]|uniref:Type II secretion system protein GspF domain-containing protein n=1 Tax=Ricinus communis TaxID=3988 RepID=B9TCU7_RICCO|nr:conserved hypothetical protein [Ricinus communis]
MPNEQMLTASLQQQGLELLTFRMGQPWFWRQPRVNTQTLILFCVQMEQLLQAGVPLLQALADLDEQNEHQGMKAALRNVQRDLEAGKLLSQALQAQPKIFPPLLGQLIDAGERTGQLPEIFGHLTRTLSWQAELRSQVRRGLTYPAVLCVMVAIAAYVMHHRHGDCIHAGDTPFTGLCLFSGPTAVAVTGGWAVGASTGVGQALSLSWLDVSDGNPFITSLGLVPALVATARHGAGAG